MRRTWGMLALAGWCGGCHTPRYDTSVPHVEEFKVAPAGEVRYDQPPEKGFTKPPPKKEFKPSFGGANGPSGPNGRGAAGQRGANRGQPVRPPVDDEAGGRHGCGGRR